MTSSFLTDGFRTIPELAASAFEKGHLEQKDF
jgi:hypothetical protein